MSNIRRISCGNVNCYIISHEGQAFLIDTGTAGYAEKVLKECMQENIKMIILTHGHCDHIQNTAFLSEKLQVPVAMGEKDVELIENNLQQTLYAGKFLGKIVLGLSIYTMKRIHKRNELKSFAPDIYLTDGMNLEPYGLPAEVIALPGHTKGSIGILLEGKDFFAGDALMNFFYPSVSLLYTDKKQMLNSAARISKLEDITVHFGHGKAINNRNWI